MDLSQIQIHIFGYGLDDWIHFWIIQIGFWVGFWLAPTPGWAESIRAHVELSRPKLMFSRVSRGNSTMDDAESNQARPMLSYVGRGRYRLSQPSPMSIRVSQGQCQAESAKVGVKPNRLGPVASRVDPGPCRPESDWTNIEQAVWADDEPNWPRMLSNRVGPVQCRAVSVRAHVEPRRLESTTAGDNAEHRGPAPNVEHSHSGQMSNGVGPGWYRAESAHTDQYRMELTWTNVEQSRPRSMSSGLIPGWCRGESTRVDDVNRTSTWADVNRIWPRSMSTGVDRRRPESKSTRISLGRFSESAWVDVERKRPGRKLTMVDPGWFSELPCVDVKRSWLGSMSRVVVDPQSLPGPMSRVVDPDRCRAKSARDNVERSCLGPISSRVAPSRCWAESSRVRVEGSRPGSVSRGVVSGRCRAESAQADVE